MSDWLIYFKLFNCIRGLFYLLKRQQQGINMFQTPTKTNAKQQTISPNNQAQENENPNQQIVANHYQLLEAITPGQHQAVVMQGTPASAIHGMNFQLDNGNNNNIVVSPVHNVAPPQALGQLSPVQANLFLDDDSAL